MSKKEKETKEETQQTADTATEKVAETTGEVTEEKAEAKAEEIKVDPKDLEIADLKDKLLRTMAEFDNYRKRTAKERMELSPEITARNLTEFYPLWTISTERLRRSVKTPTTRRALR